MVVRLYRDNPQTLASGISTVQADKPCSTLLENIIHGVDLPSLRYLVLKFWVSGNCDTINNYTSLSDIANLSTQYFVLKRLHR